ncbi:hypothetical protein MNBD_ALPHA08-903 [hydrothermal vent metagenome]|uniref:TIGR02300 family protein n=1 Tax=hydrothermal vent metagenome TaxID=652676 RepID=A0A3B0R0C4_9ZZZZ
MIDAELGKKLVCPSCSVKFYDLSKDPAECPKCDTIFSAEPILPSKEDRPPATEVKPKAIEEDKKEPKDSKEADEPEVVSLEDLVEEDDDDAEDDELAAVKDVDLGDGDKEEASTGEDDDTFLEIDDGETSNVAEIVGVSSSDEET